MSEIDAAMYGANAILDENEGRDQFKKEMIEMLGRHINLPNRCIRKYVLGPPRTENFIKKLCKVIEFFSHFRGKNDLLFQLIKKISLLSSELKSDVALYKAAFRAEKLEDVKVAYGEYQSVEGSLVGPSRSWTFCCDESFKKVIPTGLSKVRVLIKIDENQFLFERLMNLGRKLSGVGHKFYVHEMYTTECEASSMHIIFLIPLIGDKDPKKAFRARLQHKVIEESKIKEAWLISHDNKEIKIYRK